RRAWQRNIYHFFEYVMEFLQCPAEVPFPGTSIIPRHQPKARQVELPKLVILTNEFLPIREDSVFALYPHRGGPMEELGGNPLQSIRGTQKGTKKVGHGPLQGRAGQAGRGGLELPSRRPGFRAGQPVPDSRHSTAARFAR